MRNESVDFLCSHRNGHAISEKLNRSSLVNFQINRTIAEREREHGKEVWCAL